MSRPYSHEASYLQFNHVQIEIGHVSAKRCRTFDDNVVRSIVHDLKASCNSIVAGEDGVGEHGSNIRVIVVHCHFHSRDIFGIAKRCRKTWKWWLALHHFVRLVGKCRYGTGVAVPDVNGRQTKITSAHIWELSPDIGQSIVPTLGADWCGGDEIGRGPSKVVGNEITRFVIDVEQVGDAITSQGEVGAIGLDCCRAC